jgi:hypothetical protein
MSVGFDLALRSARLQAVLNTLDAAPTAAKFQFYTAPRPATGAAITTQTLLGTCLLSKPAGAVSGFVLTFDPITDDIAADNTGDIAWVRCLDGDNNFVLDMGAGIAGSNQEVIFNTVSVLQGGLIEILSGAFTEPNG